MSLSDSREVPQLSTLSAVILVFLGGAMGTLLRFLLTQTIGGSPIDAGNTIANLFGSFCMGALATWLSLKLPDNDWIRPLFMVGVLGGFTTFSGAILAIVQGLGEGETASMLLILCVSVLGSIGMCAMGAWAVARLFGPSLVREEISSVSAVRMTPASSPAPAMPEQPVAGMPKSPTVQAVRARLDAAEAGDTLGETDINRRFPAEGRRAAAKDAARHEPGRTAKETTSPYDPFADGDDA